MSRRVELPTPDEVEVLIPDPGSDVKRKYRMRSRTRSVRRSLDEATDAIEKAQEKPEGTTRASREKHEEAVMRAVCDMLSVALEGGEDAPPAGDLLFDQWAADLITEDQIVGLMEALSGDPT